VLCLFLDSPRATEMKHQVDLILDIYAPKNHPEEAIAGKHLGSTLANKFDYDTAEQGRVVQSVPRPR